MKAYDVFDFPLFEGCNRSLLQALLDSTDSRLTQYAPGHLPALQDSPCRSLLLLCSGSLTACMTNAEGKELKIETLKAPEVLAPAFVYGSENRFPVTLKAETACTVWSLSRERFLDIMEQDAAVLRNFLRLISDRSLFLSRKLNEFALQSLSTRVLSFLKCNGTIQNIQDVAFIMGVARPSLSRALSLLVEQGQVRKEGSGYVLTDKTIHQ